MRPLLGAALGGTLVLGALLAAPMVAVAQERGEPDRPTEDDLFGAEDEPVPDAEPAPDPTAEPHRDRDERLLGEDASETGLEEGFLDALAEDRLQIGGQVYIRFSYATLEDGTIEDHRFAMPNLVDLYLDARPTDRLRAYVRGRLTYDPTLGRESAGLLGGQSRDNPDVLLDQLWLNFDIGKAVFVTAGQQPVRWGSARLWNPVDFLYTRRRDPLALFDERTGLPLLKIHVPIESLGWNFYAVAMLDEAFSLDRVGGAVRGEFVVSTAELAVSGMIRKGQKPRVGFDFSAGVWDLDIYGEVAVLLGVDPPVLTLPEGVSQDDIPEIYLDLFKPDGVDEDDVAVQASGGIAWTARISDRDLLIIGAEYFFNPIGWEDEEVYIGLFALGAAQPLYVGRHYAALFASLPGPGSWDDTTWTLSTVANMSDLSALTRLDFSVLVLTWLRVEAYAAVHYGNKGGELRFHVPEGTKTIKGLPIPGVGPEGLPELRAPLVDVGLNLRVAI